MLVVKQTIMITVIFLLCSSIIVLFLPLSILDFIMKTILLLPVISAIYLIIGMAKYTKKLINKSDQWVGFPKKQAMFFVFSILFLTLTGQVFKFRSREEVKHFFSALSSDKILFVNSKKVMIPI